MPHIRFLFGILTIYLCFCCSVDIHFYYFFKSDVLIIIKINELLLTVQVHFKIIFYQLINIFTRSRNSSSILNENNDLITNYCITFITPCSLWNHISTSYSLWNSFPNNILMSYFSKNKFIFLASSLCTCTDYTWKNHSLTLKY